jgi:hypothetical protein
MADMETLNKNKCVNSRFDGGWKSNGDTPYLRRPESERFNEGADGELMAVEPRFRNGD